MHCWISSSSSSHAALVVHEAAGRFGELLMDFHLVARLALLGDEIDDALDFLVGDQRALGANQFRRAGRQVEHVAFAEQFVRAHGIENGARIHFRGDLEGDTRGNVRFDDAGDDVDARTLRRDDAMNAGRARHLRDAGDGHFDIRRRDQHEVGQFVDDDDDVAQLFRDDDVFVARHHDFLVHFDGKTFGARLRFFPFWPSAAVPVRLAEWVCFSAAR